MDIMVTLFSQQEVDEIHEYHVRRRAREEGRREGREEGREEGMKHGLERGRREGMERGIERGIEKGIEKGIAAIITVLKGLDTDQAAAAEVVAQQFSLSPEQAEQKVEQYWGA